MTLTVLAALITTTASSKGADVVSRLPEKCVTRRDIFDTKLDFLRLRFTISVGASTGTASLPDTYHAVLSASQPLDYCAWRW